MPVDCIALIGGPHAMAAPYPKEDVGWCVKLIMFSSLDNTLP